MIVIEKRDAKELAECVNALRKRIQLEYKNISMRRSLSPQEREDAREILGKQENALMLCYNLLTGSAKLEIGK